MSAERATAALREQFIAVLCHDLRSPLASVAAGANLLAKHPLDENSQSIVSLMRKSVIRMTNLVDNILDFTRARSNAGLELETVDDEPIRPTIEQVLEELRSTHPEREIVAEFGELGWFSYDKVRIEQLVSNLVGNAITLLCALKLDVEVTGSLAES
ncbi:MAG: HAMP domain-containing histidine kinase [Alphaproteobacteria bacterium]|nr:HAMP domain-containing histidine kinase [Alphaproteobacteria bacterium]MBU0805390.1 HAMP domain-containing histidine kinase [Alphaproteobacteria bacterium]MBU0873336.1 HAMP domain-containing histidine kinase [Alphaproteobacteria bacterium]MBU1401436.1 HAMP domain-containing histidine kinase [Alphaproteobacteria bacterium]MBU1592147.1 HAMP domain-containing histidine kinase [Alphaproteobacteria bacterium]